MYDRQTGPREAQERFGVRPAQMRDYLALVGDAIDNVAKVPGIGPKTAVDLLGQFGSVETLLARLDEVKKPKVRESLRANADSLLRAKQLVTVRDDLPIATDMGELARRPILSEETRALFTELEFYKLLQEMPASPQAALALRTTRVVRSPVELRAVADAVLRSGAAFVPAYSGPAALGRLIGLAIALEDDVVYLPLAHPGENLPLAAFKELLGPVFANPTVGKDGHDLKTLGNLLGTLSLELGGVRGDVELLSYLLESLPPRARARRLGARTPPPRAPAGHPNRGRSPRGGRACAALQRRGGGGFRRPGAGGPAAGSASCGRRWRGLNWGSSPESWSSRWCRC